MLRLENLSKRFGDLEVLKSVDLHAEKGQIYGLVGTNGAGKTTILKHIMKIYQQDSGEILYDELNTKDRCDYVHEFYYVQDDLFFPFNYSLDDLYNYEKMLYPKMDEKKYNKLLVFFNMDSKKKLKTLSKGQKRQAAFILAVSACPKVLLLDEIVDGLDVVVRKKFWNVIMTEVLDEETTIIISSHALNELDNICDKIGMLHEGEIIKEESMDTLKEETIRVQFAIKDEFKTIESGNYDVLKVSKIGSVYFVVIRGDVHWFKNDLYNNHEVLLFDELAMNLEEIFITELGGLGYGIEEYDA